jgi:hypothetical protein
MNNLFLRTCLVLLHAVTSIVLVSYLVDYDITGKWIKFIGFLLLLLLLLFLFVKHLIAFYYFIKTKPK